MVVGMDCIIFGVVILFFRVGCGRFGTARVLFRIAYCRIEFRL